jgi:hypothetical protein
MSGSVGATGSAVPHTVRNTDSASFVFPPHTVSQPFLSPSGDSTVSSSTAETAILPPDFASFRDSVQSSLDNMQNQLNDVTRMTHNLEANVQLGLNTRFGTMSARLMEFQLGIERILMDESSKSRDALIGIRQTLREEFTSLRDRSSLPSGNFSSASAPPYRSTSHMGTFRNSPPDQFSSRNSSPLSIHSHESRTDSSRSVATVLLGSSPAMDSSRVVIDISLTKMEPTGRISDYDSSRKFLLDFRRYRQAGGSKKLSTLLQVPLDPKKPLISNFSSLFFGFDDNFLHNDEYIEQQLISVFPETLSTLNVTSRLRNLCMSETEQMDPKKLIDFLDNFLSIYRFYGSEFQRKYDNDEHKWNTALCKLFCQLIRPSYLPARLDIEGIYEFATLQQQFRTKVLQYQNSQQLSGKPGHSITDKTVSCRNCKHPHHVNDCRKPCTHSLCKDLPHHSAKDCSNWRSNKSKNPPTSTSSPSKVSVAPASKAKKVTTSSSVVSSILPDTEVIFDSGSAVTTLPSSTFLSRTSTIPIPPLKVETADGSIHTSESTGIFQGLPSHVLPSFPDILICLSDYLSQGRIAIIDSSAMHIFAKTLSIDNFIDQFRSKFIHDSIITVPVKDKIYSVPVTEFSSSSVINNESVLATLPSLPFSPAYVVRNYETANFTN